MAIAPTTATTATTTTSTVSHTVGLGTTSTSHASTSHSGSGKTHKSSGFDQIASKAIDAGLGLLNSVVPGLGNFVKAICG